MVKLAINGFGRIGMSVAKVILDNYSSLQIIAINDLVSEEELKRVFANDPVYGPYDKQLSGVVFLAEKDPSLLPWKDLGIDIVLECSGLFTEKDGAEKHIVAGARKVIISTPSKSVDIPTYLLGVNANEYNAKKDSIISMGSCTTNAVAPVSKVVDKALGIKKGFINTIHSYTNSQNKLYPNWRSDAVSKLSVIPATTGATKTVEKCLPKLKGKLNGLSLRVPTETVSLVEMVFLVKKKKTAEEINRILEQAADKCEMAGILKFSTENLVSSQLKKNTYSSIIASNLTQSFGNLIRVFAWYDNEWGYCCRLAEITNLVVNSL